MTNKKSKKLTIAIPTYNRLDKLKLCLERLLEQKSIDEVEVIVSDNASTDGTQLYMQKEIQKGTNIKYYRNSENIGPDRNFLNCYEKASAEYILLLGDDDYLLPHAVEHLLDILEQNPVFLHLNTCGVIEDNPLVCGNPRWKPDGVKIYTDRNDILKEMGIFLTFMSSLVLKTELVRKIEHKERFIGTYFIQSYIALCTMKIQGVYMIDTFNYLAATVNETVGYDLYEVWFYNYHRLLLEGGTYGGFEAETLSDVYYQSTKSVIRGFVYQFRCRCRNEASWKKGYIWPCLKEYKGLLCEVWLMSNCPIWFLKAMHTIHDFCTERKKRLV